MTGFDLVYRHINLDSLYLVDESNPFYFRNFGVDFFSRLRSTAEEIVRDFGPKRCLIN